MLRFTVALILAVVILPALVMIPLSFTPLNYFVYPLPGFSLKWYERFLGNEQWVDALLRSIRVALSTAVIATVLGTMAAYAMAKLRLPCKNLIMNIMLVPMIVPVVIVGVAVYSSFAPLGLTNSEAGLILSHSLLAIPMVFITMLSGFLRLDPNLELAAKSLGSNPIGVFFKVQLPNVKTSLTASVLFSLVTSLDEVVVTIFVSGANTKTLPILMWENMRATIDPTLAVAAAFLIVFTVGLYFIKEFIDFKMSK